jgi:hypothetical protein
VKPVYIGDTIRARSPASRRRRRRIATGQIPQGVVHWDVEVTNQDAEPWPVYTILTLVRQQRGASMPGLAERRRSVARGRGSTAGRAHERGRR